MKPVFQTEYGGPGKGNCFIACVASILETTIEALPQEIQNSMDWFFHLRRYCMENGMFVVFIPHAIEEGFVPVGTHMITAFTVADSVDKHAVITQPRMIRTREMGTHEEVDWDFEIVHDPNQSPVPVPLLDPVSHIIIGRLP